MLHILQLGFTALTLVGLAQYWLSGPRRFHFFGHRYNWTTAIGVSGSSVMTSMIYVQQLWSKEAVLMLAANGVVSVLVGIYWRELGKQDAEDEVWNRLTDEGRKQLEEMYAETRNCCR